MSAEGNTIVYEKGLGHKGETIHDPEHYHVLLVEAGSVEDPFIKIRNILARTERDLKRYEDDVDSFKSRWG